MAASMPETPESPTFTLRDVLLLEAEARTSSNDLPPAYTEVCRPNRRSRRHRTNHAREGTDVTVGSNADCSMHHIEESEEHGRADESTPLLARRARGLSVSTTITNASTRTPHTLFQLILSTPPASPTIPLHPQNDHTPPSRLKAYFRPLVKRSSYRSLAHLLIINFPFALLAWIYLFVGTLVGTTLLLTLPLGCVVWWFTLVGSRVLSNAEISLQKRFHHPTGTLSLPSSRVVFRRPLPASSPSNPSNLEEGADSDSPLETHDASFLRNTYAMFLDPTSYQPIFYFLVIKASVTLVLTPLLLALVPVSLILVLPAPAVLRLVRMIGLWQARVAFDGLS